MKLNSSRLRKSGMSLFLPAVAVLSGILVLARSTPAAAQDAPAPPQGSAHQDLLFLSSDRPIVIRLQLEIEGRSFVDVWRSMALELFRGADGNGDGFLSPEELRSPSKEAASPLHQELLSVLDAPGLMQADVENPDGQLSPEEFMAFLARSKGGPFQPPASQGNEMRPTAAGSRVSVSPSGVILFELLDQDHDGRVSRQELEDGPRSLRARDFDGDGASSAIELDHLRSPFGGAPAAAATINANSVPLVSLRPGAVSANLLELVLKRYQGPRDEQLRSIPVQLLSLPAAEELRYDEDQNGRLDSSELRAWLADPFPHVVIKVRLGALADGVKAIEVVTPPGDGLTVKFSELGLASLVMGGTHLELGTAPRLRDVELLTGMLQQAFKTRDGDGNGYLDQTEANQLQFLNESFSTFDRDADGKVFESEFFAVLEGRIHTSIARVQLSATNRGRDLMEILDVNRDQRLTAREFAGAVSRFDVWDANGNGFLEENEIPQLYQLVFDRGAPDLPGLSISAGGASGNRSAETRLGPKWFQDMDLNQDGDVSRREFLGRIQQFEALDLDGDGLIDLHEASSAAVK